MIWPGPKADISKAPEISFTINHYYSLVIYKWLIHGWYMDNLWLMVNSYSLVNIQKTIENTPFIVDLPSYKMAIVLPIQNGNVL